MKKLIVLLYFAASLQASTSISSITCSGQTATVNSTAHGLIASQGFSLSGTAATFNSTTTSATANAFTLCSPLERLAAGSHRVTPACKPQSKSSRFNRRPTRCRER